MRMGSYAVLLFFAGMLSVCLFDILAQLAHEHKRLADERAKGISLEVQLRGKR